MGWKGGAGRSARKAGTARATHDLRDRRGLTPPPSGRLVVTLSYTMDILSVDNGVGSLEDGSSVDIAQPGDWRCIRQARDGQDVRRTWGERMSA